MLIHNDNWKKVVSSLFLVAAWCSTTTSTFKFASLGSDIWSRVWVRNTRSLSEVLACLTSITFALHQNCVLSSWWQEGQLIESEHFTASLDDSLACTLGDSQSTDANFWNIENSQVVCDSSDNDGNISLFCLASLHQAQYALKRNNWLVDATHEETAQNDFVELLMGSSIQESIELKREGNFCLLVRLCRFF